MRSTMHAHFDCFGGAAGDMMLAACIDAADSLPFPLPSDLDRRRPSEDDTVTTSHEHSNSERLLSRIIFDLEHGLPELKGEFHLSSKRVWRSAGRIAARKINVSSLYDHKAAPVPGGINETNLVIGKENVVQMDGGQPIHHDHDHSHGHQHSHQHNHQHTHAHHHSLPSELEEDPRTNVSIDDKHNMQNDNNHSHHHDHHTRDDHSHSHHGHDHNHNHGHGHNHNHHHNHSHVSAGKLRNLPQISLMLRSAPSQYIPNNVACLAIEAFTALAHAEMHAHGSSSINNVHFHEVGAVDSIVDTVGTLLALYHLGVDLGGDRRQVAFGIDGNISPPVAVTCSALPLGEGTVMTDHGLLPVPAPAALRLMIGMPTCPGPAGPTGELVTPTAVALLRVLTGVDSNLQDYRQNYLSSSSYWQPMQVPGRPPRMVVRAVGLGAGSKDFERHANILRLVLGDVVVGACGNRSDAPSRRREEEIGNEANDSERHLLLLENSSVPEISQHNNRTDDLTASATPKDDSSPWDVHTLTHIEANIDDATPELLAHALNLLLENGAIDAWIYPIIMKKGRPAHSLNCICHSVSTNTVNMEERLLNVMFRHTTTVGIRIHRNILRAALQRRFVEVQLPHTDNTRCGRVDVKISSFNSGEIVSMKPEFDHCKVISEESDIPLKVVSNEAERMVSLGE